MADTDSRPAATISKKKRSSLPRELAQTLVLTVLIFLGVRTALQNFRVEGGSMLPNLHTNEYVLVNKVDYMLHSPQRGDVVVFKAVPALQPDRDFIKRVIGLPGETVSVRGGYVYINGRRLREGYITEPAAYTFPAQKIPQDSYFVLGDHRNNSFDSSKWTTTPWLARQYIIGKAWLAYWPFSNLGFFSTPSYR